MLAGDWTGLLASQRMTDLHREAERQRLVRLAKAERRGGRRRLAWSIGWHGQVSSSRRRVSGCGLDCDGDAPGSDREASGRERGWVDGPLRGSGAGHAGWPLVAVVGGLQVSSEGGESALSGTLPDQSALHGVLDKVFDLGLAVVTVRRLPPEELGGERR
jgi:hypothetical protein